MHQQLLCLVVVERHSREVILEISSQASRGCMNQFVEIKSRRDGVVDFQQGPRALAFALGSLKVQSVLGRNGNLSRDVLQQSSIIFTESILLATGDFEYAEKLVMNDEWDAAS